MSSDARWEMRGSDLRGWLENIITPQLWDTNYLWLLVIHSVTTARNLLSCINVACSHRTRCHRSGKKTKKNCFAYSPSAGPQLQVWSGGGAADEKQSAAAGASAHPDTGMSVRQWNDLLCKPLFISDNMPSGYFGINGSSHWKVFIDVDSHTFCAARSSHGPVMRRINERVMGI